MKAPNPEHLSTNLGLLYVALESWLDNPEHGPPEGMRASLKVIQQANERVERDRQKFDDLLQWAENRHKSMQQETWTQQRESLMWMVRRFIAKIKEIRSC